ncbi:hypothetical protein RFI_27674 [Reticulomyxa filosa]|uniref:Uncharacterized protein n=1 Tax=Reticulomyxa filosa TaxID=46433 RepID=X6M6Z8_RETFI|nr:hypothetical protein RFI_27674 [Reticulomyxa filosa]|eukprot:ETO09704.1 hypothetical protein RFI_27674 [Reticulomyxa filosa]
MQQLMAMQYAQHIDQVKSWDNYSDNTIFLQCYLRGSLQRVEYLQLKESVRVIQQNLRIMKRTREQRFQFLCLFDDCKTLQATIRTYFAVQKIKSHWYDQSTRTLQATIHSYLLHKKYSALKKHSLCLQACVRTRQCQLESLRTLRVCIKSNRTLPHDKHVDSTCCKQSYLTKRMKELRDEILSMWTKTWTAFNYRAKFWLVFNSPTYLNLSIHCEEFDRLKTLSEEMTKSPDKHKEQVARFEAERKELYRILKENTPPSVLLSFYSTLHIDIRSKHKKDQLLQLLFSSDMDPVVSATITLGISGSSPAHILDVTSQIELRRAERIRTNLMLTVQSSLQSLRALHRIATIQELTNKRHLQYIDHLRDELGLAQEVEKDLELEHAQLYHHHTDARDSIDHDHDVSFEHSSLSSRPVALPFPPPSPLPPLSSHDGLPVASSSSSSLAHKTPQQGDMLSLPSFAPHLPLSSDVDQYIVTQLRLQKRRKKYLSSRFATKKSLDNVFGGWYAAFTYTRIPSIQTNTGNTKAAPLGNKHENKEHNALKNEQADEKGDEKTHEPPNEKPTEQPTGQSNEQLNGQPTEQSNGQPNGQSNKQPNEQSNGQANENVQVNNPTNETDKEKENGNEAEKAKENEKEKENKSDGQIQQENATQGDQTVIAKTD